VFICMPSDNINLGKSINTLTRSELITLNASSMGNCGGCFIVGWPFNDVYHLDSRDPVDSAKDKYIGENKAD